VTEGTARTQGRDRITLAHVAVSNPPTVPAGALSIAGALAGAGYNVDFRDCTSPSYRHLASSDLASRLDSAAPVIGVGCMSDTLPFVIAALEDLKARRPQAVVVLGGPGPSGVAGELVRAFPFVDVVVVGEGEATVLELMERLGDGLSGANLREVKGVSFSGESGAVVTPARERIRDLDRLPLPLYEAVKVERYPMVNIVFSRGCPYRCTFCDVAPMWQRKHVRRSVDAVVEEIRLLKTRYGRTRFEFTDETFVLGREKIFEFCDRLKREGLGIKWSCTGRVNLVARDMLAEMASAGCEAMFFGIESGSDRVLELVTKDFTVAEAVEALHLTLEFMRPVASFIWGFPFETEDDLVETLLLTTYLSQVGVDSRLNRLAPFPLMPLYQEFGKRVVWRDDQASSTGGEPFETAGYPRRVVDLVKGFPEIFPSFYWFDGEGMDAKRRLVGSAGRYWQTADWPEEPDGPDGSEGPNGPGARGARDAPGEGD
jgi:anaerobic magnesium-protoporphyrin IX monomethyl ester cyclase